MSQCNLCGIDGYICIACEQVYKDKLMQAMKLIDDVYSDVSSGENTNDALTRMTSLASGVVQDAIEYIHESTPQWMREG
jgi:hypothetical protein